MTEILRLLLFPFVAMLAWRMSRSSHSHARKASRVLALVMVAILLGIAITGWMPSEPRGVGVHRWMGHTLANAAWLFVPFAIGVGLQQNAMRRPGYAIAQTVIVIASLALVFLASFTGYLSPSHIENMAEETKNRFIILHQFLLPVLITITLVAWYWLFREESRRLD